MTKLSHQKARFIEQTQVEFSDAGQKLNGPEEERSSNSEQNESSDVEEDEVSEPEQDESSDAELEEGNNYVEEEATESQQKEVQFSKLAKVEDQGRQLRSITFPPRSLLALHHSGRTRECITGQVM